MEKVESDRLRSGFATPNRPRAILTRRERLERWADALDRSDPDGRHSPIDIAWSDPLLRSQGLESPTIIDAAAFFGLDAAAAKRLALPVSRVETRIVARRLRKFAARNDRTMLAAGVAAVGVVSVPLLAYLFA
ncbi:MAG: hypothetical protein EA385_03500 [Salinarimonadaceae bacterium]|nr:MAG: hypothetical protein EA385_03500 [Salinarimonadaceae bacterium]